MADFQLVLAFVSKALGLNGELDISGGANHYRSVFTFYKMRWVMFWSPEKPEEILVKEISALESMPFSIADPDCAKIMREEMRKYGMGAYNDVS